MREFLVGVLLCLLPSIASAASARVSCEVKEQILFFEFEFDVAPDGSIKSMRVVDGAGYIERRTTALIPDHIAVVIDYSLKPNGPIVYSMSIHRHTLEFRLYRMKNGKPQPDSLRGQCWADSTRKF